MKWNAALLFWLLAIIPAARAAYPEFGIILPRGGQAGTSVDVTLTGNRLDDTEEIVSYSPAIRVSNLQVVSPTEVKATFAIAPDCRHGEHIFRVRTKSGISYARTFWTGPFPTVEEAEPNTVFEEAQPVTSGVTVAGVAGNEDTDYFRLEAKKGERISVEVEGIRLGGAFWDPYVAVLDSRRFELAACDDSALLVQDAWVSVIAPEDGTYYIEVRDSSYAGNDNARYRVHIGAFPRPATAYPPGGKPGTHAEVTLQGDVGGPIALGIDVPETPGILPVFAQLGGTGSPSPVPFRVSPLENLLEAGPNNTHAEVANAEGPAPAAPLAFNGIIEEPGDHDWFRFSARKDQRFDIAVLARSLRSPLDPVLHLCRKDGSGLAGNDDNGNHPDSRIGGWTVPEDGEYCIRIMDQLGRGGPEFVYRVEITTPEPSMTATITRMDRVDSQLRQQMPVPRGNRCAVLVNLDRTNWGGDVIWEGADLPAGVTLEADVLSNGITQCPVVFQAAPDAPLAGTLAKLLPKPADPAVSVPARFLQKIEFVHGEPNETPYVVTELDTMPVAVVEEVPFAVELEKPAVPLVQSGTIDLKVRITREEGFNAPVNIRMLWNPPGLSSPGVVTIPEGELEAIYPVTASGDASVRTWKIAVLGDSDAGKGQIFASSSLTELAVAPPYLSMKMEMGSVEQGREGQLFCKLEVEKAFEGKAKVTLFGLPAKTTTEVREISATDTEVIFPIRTEPDSPTGKHQNLFCQAVIMEGGFPVVHTIGQGGVLRIDPPPPAQETPPPAAVASAEPATEKPAKPLSRLEQLRQQAASRLRTGAAAADSPQP